MGVQSIPTSTILAASDEFFFFTTTCAHTNPHLVRSPHCVAVACTRGRRGRGCSAGQLRRPSTIHPGGRGSALDHPFIQTGSRGMQLAMHPSRQGQPSSPCFLGRGVPGGSRQQGRRACSPRCRSAGLWHTDTHDQPSLPDHVASHRVVSQPSLPHRIHRYRLLGTRG